MTVLCEVEAVLNSRPLLTYLYSEDVEEPLTPSHLLIGKRLLTLPNIYLNSEVPGSSQESVTKRAKYRQSMADHVWRRWRKEYLLELREHSEHHRLVTRKLNVEPIKIGDIAVVHEDNVRRNLWRLGRIESLIYGRGRVVRGAAVELGERNRRSTGRTTSWETLSSRSELNSEQ